MTEPSLLLRHARGRLFLVFNRPERQNSFSAEQLEATHRALDGAERDPECRMIVLEGQPGYFSRGLDFADGLGETDPHGAARYLELLERLTQMPAFVVANVDGQALAGGLGFVAASDYAIASARSTFALPEATWGLVPACVGLFLRRRIGTQRTLRLSLTTETLDAPMALSAGLIDEVTDEREQALRRLWLKVARLEPRTIQRTKRYFADLENAPEVWAVQRRAALAESHRQMSDPEIRAAIADYVTHGRFPWEREKSPSDAAL